MTEPSSIAPASLSGRVGAGLIGLFVVAGAVSLFWTPHDVAVVDIAGRLAGPSAAHPLGADPFGRDVLSMLMAGARVTIAVAFGAVIIGAAIGVPLGLTAAAFGGLVDDVVARMSDIVFAFPAVILAILIAATFGPGAWNAVAAVAIFNVPVFARIARGAALPLWRSGFALAARAAGKTRLRISFEHVLPNLSRLLLAQATIQLSLAVLAEAGLSYIGLGPQPPTPSWGRMLAESQTFAFQAPLLAVFPGLAILGFVLGLNLLAADFQRKGDARMRLPA